MWYGEAQSANFILTGSKPQMLRRKNIRVLLAILILSGMMIVLACGVGTLLTVWLHFKSVPSRPAEIAPSDLLDVLEVHFIDVGQGEAILIETTNGDVVLIDGGENNGKALAYLQHEHINEIDLIFVTHPHADHSGGLVEI